MSWGVDCKGGGVGGLQLKGASSAERDEERIFKEEVVYLQWLVSL